MDKKPFYFTCPKCGYRRFVLPMRGNFRCAACNSQVRVRSEGAYLIESVLLAPASLILYGSVAAFLQSRGLDRDASQGCGIFAAFLITLPVYVALRPYLVGLESIEPADATQSKQDQ
ncbi:MAG: TFIIB-type zinc ribbon-containing protein [Ramlibacter sp.]|nr:TFIIB-type zinc ribbon-containing protein [Ramlibacter sp.]